MPVTLTRGDDTITVVSQSELNAAVKRGFTPQPGGTLSGRDGLTRKIDDPERLVEHAQRSGQQPEHPVNLANRESDKRREINYGGLSEQIRTGGEGVLDLFSLGGYSAGARLLGLEEGIRQRAAENPGSRMIGTGIGLALTLGGGAAAFTPAGLVTSAGSKIASRGTLGASVTAATLEGAAFGLGQEVSNISLQNEPLTKEAVAADLLTGLGAGALFGLGAGVLGHGMVKVGKKLQKNAARHDDIARAQKELTDPHGAINTAWSGATRNLSTTTDNVINELDDGAKLWAKERSTVSVDALNARFNAMQEHAGKAHMLAGVSRIKVDSEFIQILKAREQVKSFFKQKKWTDAAKSLEFMEDATRKMIQKVGANLDEFNMKLAELPSAFVKQPPVKGDISKQILRLSDELKSARESVRKITNRPLSELLKKPQEKFVNDLQNLNNYYTKLRDYSKGTTLAQDVADELTVLTQTSSDALGTIGSLFKPTMTAKELAENAGMNLLAKNLDNIVPELHPLAKLYAGQMVATGGVSSGNVTKGILGSIGAGAARGSVTGVPGVGGGALRNAASFLGYKLGVGLATSAGALAASAGRVQQIMRKSVGKFMTSGGKTVKRTAAPGLSFSLLSDKPDNSSREEQFFNRQKEITTLVANEAGTMQRLFENLTPVRQIHMGVGDGVATIAMNIAKFLYTVMPKDPGNLYISGQSVWKPSRKELHDFDVAYRASVNGPAYLVESLLNGTGGPLEASVFRILFPHHFSEFTQILQMEVANGKVKLNRNQRNRLGVILKIPFDSRQRPEFTQFMQNMYSTMEQQDMQMSAKMPVSNKPEQLTPAQESTIR